MTEGCLTTMKVSLSRGMRAKQCYLRDGGSPVDQSFKWLDMRGAKRIKKKEEESVHRVLLIKNEFAISAFRNLPLAARLCHVPTQRDSGISAPRAASWLRSAALRAQAAVAPEWCHVVGIYSSKFNFQLSFLPWQKPCLWDFSIQLSLCGSSGMMRGTDPSVILQKKKQNTELQSSTKTTYWQLYTMITWQFVYCLDRMKKKRAHDFKQTSVYQAWLHSTSALQLHRFMAELKHVHKDMEVWSRAEEILWV